jgi:hypothetical protein
MTGREGTDPRQTRALLVDGRAWRLPEGGSDANKRCRLHHDPRRRRRTRLGLPNNADGMEAFSLKLHQKQGLTPPRKRQIGLRARHRVSRLRGSRRGRLSMMRTVELRLRCASYFSFFSASALQAASAANARGNVGGRMLLSFLRRYRSPFCGPLETGGLLSASAHCQPASLPAKHRHSIPQCAPRPSRVTLQCSMGDSRPPRRDSGQSFGCDAGGQSQQQQLYIPTACRYVCETGEVEVAGTGIALHQLLISERHPQTLFGPSESSSPFLWCAGGWMLCGGCRYPGREASPS